jgi:hypothetical protein
MASQGPNAPNRDACTVFVVGADMTRPYPKRLRANEHRRPFARNEALSIEIDIKLAKL